MRVIWLYSRPPPTSLLGEKFSPWCGDTGWDYAVLAYMSSFHSSVSHTKKITRLKNTQSFGHRCNIQYTRIKKHWLTNQTQDNVLFWPSVSVVPCITVTQTKTLYGLVLQSSVDYSFNSLMVSAPQIWESVACFVS